MSRIAPTPLANPLVAWTEKKQGLIKSHPAWHGFISEQEAERCLKHQPSFTYLLRQGEHQYFISFVKEDGAIKHQFFVLEHSRQGWYYRNGGTGGPQEIVSENLEELIPMMMHCRADQCRPLKRN